MIMKRWISLVLVLGVTAGAASAQTSGRTSSRSTSVSSTGSYNAKEDKNLTVSPSAVLDNRKNYHWKNGQTSTPTGYEAAPTSGGYQSLNRVKATVKEEENN